MVRIPTHCCHGNGSLMNRCDLDLTSLLPSPHDPAATITAGHKRGTTRHKSTRRDGKQ
jgi:hypothetical protein